MSKLPDWPLRVMTATIDRSVVLADMQKSYEVRFAENQPQWTNELKPGDLVIADHSRNLLSKIVSGVPPMILIPCFYEPGSVSVEPRNKAIPKSSPKILGPPYVAKHLVETLGLNPELNITAVHVIGSYSEFPKLVVEYLFTDEMARKLGWSIHVPKPSTPAKTVRPSNVPTHAPLWKRLLKLLRPRTGRQNRKTAGR